MKTKTRFIKSVIDTAAKYDRPMPWARGARRAVMIAARRAPHELRAVKTA